MTKLTKWFQTDLGFHATKERILRLQHERKVVLLSDSIGRPSFYFKHLKDATFQITTKGKLGIFHPETFSLQECIDQVKASLVRPNGEPAHIIADISLDTPKGKSKTGLFDWWERRAERKRSEREKRLFNSDVERYVAIERCLMIEDEWSPEKDAELYKKYRRLLKDKYPDASS